MNKYVCEKCGASYYSIADLKSLIDIKCKCGGKLKMEGAAEDEPYKAADGGKKET
jgi:DNA-directed RNA polymerase subunit RPC12/RpoP